MSGMRNVPNGVPAAVRASRPGWRDPRILLGVALMAVSVLAGAWLGRTADDTVPVLVAAHDLPVGVPLDASDVTIRRVHLSGHVADLYLRALGPRRTLAVPVRSGELVPRSALAGPAAGARVEVPLSVAADDLPATVVRGSVVDVWAVPDADRQPGARARLVLEGVTVLALGERSGALAPQPTRQVIVTVPAADTDELATALGRTTAGRLVLVRRG
jgi:Flp pilus assembly protein CpaB